jgi:hypothetical protein
VVHRGDAELQPRDVNEVQVGEHGSSPGGGGPPSGRGLPG